MADPAIPDGVTTELTDTTASATASVAAPPDAVFDYLRDPANHPAISGDLTVQAEIDDAGLLEAESTFRMKMRKGPLPYRIKNKVVEFDRGHVIAWTHLGGHRWRWVVTPDGEGASTVTETYDQSTARVPIVLRWMGFPKGHLVNVARSVANVAAHFAES